LILGFGVYLEVLANVVMLPGESFVRAVVFTWKTEFGTSKMIFDVSMTVIAGIMAIALTGKLQGVREGTVYDNEIIDMISGITDYEPGYIAQKEHLNEEKAGKEIVKKDKQRAYNYRYYTGQIWGLSSNYHLSLDTSFGEQFMDEAIIQVIKNRYCEKNK
jgi:hypothetical protein